MYFQPILQKYISIYLYAIQQAFSPLFSGIIWPPVSWFKFGPNFNSFTKGDPIPCLTTKRLLNAILKQLLPNKYLDIKVYHVNCLFKNITWDIFAWFRKANRSFNQITHCISLRHIHDPAYLQLHISKTYPRPCISSY